MTTSKVAAVMRSVLDPGVEETVIVRGPPAYSREPAPPERGPAPGGARGAGDRPRRFVNAPERRKIEEPLPAPPSPCEELADAPIRDLGLHPRNGGGPGLGGLGGRGRARPLRRADRGDLAVGRAGRSGGCDRNAGRDRARGPARRGPAAAAEGGAAPTAAGGGGAAGDA